MCRHTPGQHGDGDHLCRPARRQREYETLTTLKNARYDPEQKFGHGRRLLSIALTSLTVLAFPSDLVEGRCRAVFQAGLEVAGSLLYLREEMQSCFLEFSRPTGKPCTRQS